MDRPTFYDVLGVSPEANQTTIREAYVRLARQYHPDINKSPGATQRMTVINVAYQTLSDPVRRRQYDESIGLVEPAAPHIEEEAYDWSWLRCDSCGRIDSSLRFTVFLFVVSLLIVTFKRGAGGGLLCSSCRPGQGITYAVLSLLLGPWGLPWGIIYTLQALFSNLTGGVQPKEMNGPMLRLLAAYLYSTGRADEAVEALRASISYEEDGDTRHALNEVLREMQRAAETEAAEREAAREAGAR